MGWLRVALCQVDAVVGDLDGNVRRVLDGLERAEELDADVALFPELVVTGYPPEDLLLEPEFVAASEQALAAVAASSGECAGVVGYVADSAGLRNAAALCWRGKVRGVSVKELLPNYGVFDEQRWFVPGAGDSPVYRIGGAGVGVVICEDAWQPLGPIGRLAGAGAGIVLSCNASPYRAGARAERQGILVQRAVESRCAIAYVNLVGGQDELVFDGGSLVIAPDGSLLASVAQFREDIVAVDVPFVGDGPEVRPGLVEVSGARHRRGGASPGTITPVLGGDAETYEALVLATRDYAEKNGFVDCVVALSGGIDSSLVAAIAVDAVGASRVHGVAMPSRFSSVTSLADATALARNLGIELIEIPIEPAHEVMLGLLAPSFDDRPPGVAEENLQARIRGTLLMALSNKFGWLVLTTGNKSETAVGYSTLYGDTAGGFAVIRDVPKLLVYTLVAYRNAQAGRDLIPEQILTKPPSAELRPDQRDEDSLPPYAVLDPILEAYVERHATVDELVAGGFDAAMVRQIFDLVDAAEYKRRQAPPGPRVTSRAFGKDRRMPITNRFRSGGPPGGRASP
ncbi:MAG TPA: NAD+ synthase [Acidimicrobiales bacterium]|nr:NAD+ synthase [Acidimicrobiales bacterium]